MARIRARIRREDNQVPVGRPGIDSSVSDALTTATALVGDVGEGIAKAAGTLISKDRERERNFQLFQADDKDKAARMQFEERIKNFTDADLNGRSVDEVTDELFTEYRAQREEIANGISDQRAKERFVGTFPEQQLNETFRQAVKQRNDISISTQTTATFNKTIEEADSIENAIAVGDDLEFIGETGYRDRVIGWDNLDVVDAKVSAAKKDAYTRGLRAEIQKNPEIALKKLSNPKTRAQFEQVMGADNVESLHQAAVSGQVRKVQAAFQRTIGTLKGSTKLETAGRTTPGLGYSELVTLQNSMGAAYERSVAALNLPGLSDAERDMIALGQSQLTDAYVNNVAGVFNEVRGREYVFKVLATPGVKADPSNPVAVQFADDGFKQDIIPQLEANYSVELQEAQLEGRQPNLESVADLAAQQVEGLGFAPPAFNAWVKRLSESDDPKQVELSLRIMERERAVHPPSFAALPEETRSQLTAYSVLTDAGLSEQEAADQARQLATGNYRTERGQALQQEWTTFAEDERITTGLADTMKSELSPWYAFGVPDSFPPEAQRHFKMLVQRNYVLMQEQGENYFNPETRMKLAIQKAGQDFQGVYNVTKIGASKVWMRGAPEAEFAIAGREDQSKWMGSHLKQALSTDATERVLLDDVELFQYPDSPDGKPVYAVFQRTDVGIKPVLHKNGGQFIWRPDWSEAPENIANRMTAEFIRADSSAGLEAAVKAKVSADGGSESSARTELLQAQRDFQNGTIYDRVVTGIKDGLRATQPSLEEREQMRLDAERRAQETINANLGQ